MTRQGEREPSRYMRLDEVAHQLGVSRSTILNKIYEGQLVGVNVATKGSSQLRVTRSSFEAYCDAIEREASTRFDAGAA
jgi:excisionase family DNA binding protein